MPFSSSFMPTPLFIFICFHIIFIFWRAAA
jgi:hypothetical protein